VDSRGRRQHRRRNRAIAGAAVAAAGSAAGLIISAATAAGAPALRTAVVTSSAVTRTLSVSGTVRPVHEAVVDFQVAGTVSAVDVSKGQTVTRGQTLATVDTSSIQTAVNEAQAQLTAAQAKLIADENNEPTSSTGNQGLGSANTAAYVSGAPRSGAEIVLTSATAPSGPTASAITKDQQAVVSAQHTLDLDLQAAAADLAQMQQDCADVTSTSTSSTTSTTVPSTSTTTTPPSSSTSACATDLSTASQAEQRVSADESKLATAENSLARALASAAPSSSSSTPGTGRGGTSTPPTGSNASSSSSAARGSSSARSSSSTGSSGAATTTNTDTPQQLASDQSTIDSDEANLVNAHESLDSATLVSPIGGTVEAVGITTGQAVSSGSSTASITIVSPGAYEVSASLPTSQVQGVATGEPAQVSVDSTTGTFTAAVTQVGPVSLSNSSYVYPLVITLDAAAGQLPAGEAAHAVIDLAQAGASPVVPTSAVHTTGVGQAYVYVDRAGKAVQTSVKVGLVGAVYTQITSGLSDGEVVVLADPSQPVPASSANANIRSFTGTGGFPGGGGGTFRFTAPGGQSVQVQIGGGGGKGG
jgi:RND family efflux transporter MFP subunit